jgi:hypothetical protein
LIFSLVAIAFLINQSALSGFWRFDDGWLLDYASRFRPADYFLVPAVTRGYSFNNLTPFNPLLYDINLWLFGVSPRGFYVQHLSLMAGCAAATFLLLRIWLSPGFAFTGALLFLIGAPSLIVSQQLMVGHYLAGLLFSILCIHAFVRGVERGSGWLAAIAALLYLFATACKEIYVPLPLVLLFMPKATLRKRILHSLPLFAWTLCYAVWRYLVLGGFIGGYGGNSQAVTWNQMLAQIAGIPQLLLGDTPMGIAAMVLLIALFGYALISGRFRLPLVVACAAAVALPLLPLLGYPGITRADRYLFLPWWLVSVTTALIIANLPAWRFHYRMGIGLLLTLVVASHSYQVMGRVQPRLDEFDTSYRLFASPAKNTVFFSTNKNAYHQDTVLNGLRNALNRVDDIGLQRIGILTRKEDIPLLASSLSIVHYEQSCNCIRNLGTAAGDKPVAEKDRLPEILVVTLSPPYPPLFDPADGKIEQFENDGKNLRIAGWTQQPPGDIEQQLLLVTPINPQQRRISARHIDAPDRHTQRQGFELRLSYPDERSAAAAQSRLCLLTRSMLTPVRLIPGLNDNNCSEFLRTPQ